jgi:predicted DNA-binding protein YlxM (UPF0122 family)
MNRINADIDTSRRQAMAIENNIRDSREKLLTLEHKLDFKVGLELQLEEVKEQLAEHTNECKVRRSRKYLNTCCMIFTYNFDLLEYRKRC